MFKREYQKIKKIGFLGPSGTFTEEAASSLNGELKTFDSISGVLDAVKNKNVDLGVVPIENSIEGPVGLVLDLLVHNYNLRIFKELILPIRHNLLLNKNAKMEDIEIIFSVSQALSQCRKFIEDLGVKTRGTSSTAAAAEMILGKKKAAAIGTEKAAEIYGLKIELRNIQDYKNNLTRFIVLSDQDHLPTGRDKTSVIFSLIKDRSGGLYEILGEFAKADVNLTKIESRPSKEKLGRYIFFIDFEGHRKNESIVNVLNIIRSKVRYIKILGSYPSAGEG
jgi:prephenate dehydratase